MTHQEKYFKVVDWDFFKKTSQISICATLPTVVVMRKDKKKGEDKKLLSKDIGMEESFSFALLKWAQSRDFFPK